jgi:hypothetical protein
MQDLPVVDDHDVDRALGVARVAAPDDHEELITHLHRAQVGRIPDAPCKFALPASKNPLPATKKALAATKRLLAASSPGWPYRWCCVVRLCATRRLVLARRPFEVARVSTEATAATIASQKRAQALGETAFLRW